MKQVWLHNSKVVQTRLLRRHGIICWVVRILPSVNLLKCTLTDNQIQVGIVSITEEENSRLPFETAPNLFKENEYVVELNIFHQLHCLVYYNLKSGVLIADTPLAWSPTTVVRPSPSGLEEWWACHFLGVSHEYKFINAYLSKLDRDWYLYRPLHRTSQRDFDV